MTRQSKAARLKALIGAPAILVMPTAYDAISAKLVEEASFSAVQCSGYAVAASRYGVPDLSIASMYQMAEAAGVIARAVDVPVMGDADDGYGNAINVWHTIRTFESAGVAGVNLEDQAFPKRCGQREGKRIVEVAEMVGKIEAAVDARIDPDFVINARTDALPLSGMDDVLARAKAYMRAGATMMFVEGVANREQIRRLVGEIDGPVAINLMESAGEHALSDVTFEELERLGVARVSLSVTTLLGAIQGIRNALRDIRERGSMPTGPVTASISELHQLSGMERASELEARFSHL